MELDAIWSEVHKVLQALPLVLVNPELNADTLWYDEAGMAKAAHWGRWSLDPLGAGWSMHDNALEELTVSLERAMESGSRSALKSVSAVHARLSARVYMLEQLIARQQYVQALDLIPLVLADVNQAGEERTAGVARRA